MINKRTTKKNNGTTRIVKKVSTQELNDWKKLLKLHGTKTDLSEKKKISRTTINNVLKNKQGEVRVLNAIRSYYKKQTAA